MGQGEDIYTNFFPMAVTSAASAATLVEESQHTPMGTVANVAWEIEMVEWYPLGFPLATSTLTMALSTRKGVSAMPALNDKGTIAVFKLAMVRAAGGIAPHIELPILRGFMPPCLVASPNLSLYAQASTDDVDWRLSQHQVRVHFTTVNLTDKVYRELFETWNYAN